MSASTLSRWRGRTALVTGASSGIGRAIAVDLGRMGLNVALTGRREAELQVTAEAVRLAGGTPLVLTCDQTQPGVHAPLFARIRERWGGVDLLVNNAGMRGGIRLLDTDLREIEQALILNVVAAIACMQEAISDQRTRAEGAIIVLSSMTGHRVLPGTPALYAATKHALRIVTDGLRSEVAQARLPIKVALISPGMVDTPWHRQPGGVASRAGGFPHPPLQPGDIVDALRYILSTPPGVQVCDIQLKPAEQVN